MSKLSTVFYSLLLVALFMPAPSVSAQKSAQYGTGGFDQGGELSGFFSGFTGFINDVLVPLIFALSLLVFLWGVFRYFIAEQGESADRKKAKDLMLYGIGGFVLMVSIWGIVNLIAGGLNLDDDTLETGLPETPAS